MSKKVTIFSIILATFMLAISSCKTHERCPAYGKIDQQKTNKLLQV